MSNGKSSGIIRNPTPAELEASELRKVVKGKPFGANETVEVPATSNTVVYFNPHWRAPTSRFEPKPHFFKLPSRSFTGCEHIENDGIYVKRFSTTTEGILSNALIAYYNDRDMVAFFKQINIVLNDCIRSKVDIEQLALIDQMPLLLFLIGISFGGNSEFEIECDACQKNFKHKIDIAKDIEIKYLPDTFNSRATLIFDHSFETPINARITFPRLKYVDLFFDTKADRVEQYKSILSIERPYDMDDKEYDRYATDVINNLNADDKSKIRDYLEEFNKYGATFEIIKPVCQNPDCENYQKPRHLPLELDDIFQAIM